MYRHEQAADLGYIHGIKGTPLRAELLARLGKTEQEAYRLAYARAEQRAANRITAHDLRSKVGAA